MSYLVRLFFVVPIISVFVWITGCASDPAEKSKVCAGGSASCATPISYKPNPNEQTVVKSIIKYDYAAGEITKLCTDAIEKLNEKLKNQVKNAYDLEWALADFNDEVSVLTFMGYVNLNEKLRAEGSTCEENYNKTFVDVFTRRELYEAVKSTRTSNASEKRIVSELKRSFESNGMSLSDEKLAEFKALKSELASLEAKFAKNLNENKSAVEFTAKELTGVSKEFLKRLKKNKSGKYIATTKSTDFIQVMENAKNPMTRKKMLMAYDNREAEVNTELLEKAVQLRSKIALLMGYKQWADYRIDGRMAKNSKAALNLLTDLREKLGKRLDADLDVLLSAKKTMEDQSAQSLNAWDIRYFAYQVKKRDYNLDDEVIREYFPKDTVMAGLFEVYSTLFNVYFEEVKDASVWAPEVKLYAVREKSNKSIVSYFYTDLVPREGKYGHAAAFPLISGRVMKQGYYSQPVASIVANFTPPANGKPSLLTHDEVETLFHEFGHIMHQTLTKAPYAYLSGSSTAQDFVEAPSQMLENWVWDAKMLHNISGHYTDSSKKLPDELIAKMIAAKDFNQGYFYSRQLLLGLTDMTMHTTNQPVDVTSLFQKLHQEILHFPTVEGSHFCASFGHLMGGYDAGYYGYLWSEVFAADMFTAFSKNGILDEQTGLKYRRAILEKGNMQDPIELITEFLGRKPNNEAFLKKLGL